jgi:Bacterial extracellular solute-binding protein
MGFFCGITIFFVALNQIVFAAEAWVAEWERTIKAAESEGEVSYYTLGEYGFLGEFEKKFPRIKVKVVPGRGNELLARIMTERRAGKYLADVARIGNTSPYSLYQAKVLQPVASAFILPEVKDETKWWSGKHQYVDSEGKYIFVPVGSVSVNMVAHNTELVSQLELSSFWDLLNERLTARGHLQKRFTSDGAPQGGSKVYGDVEGGVDGCRTHAKSGEPGPGKEWEEAVASR